MSIQVFGITGTNGKTTTSYMLKEILTAAGKDCSLVGTIGHHIGKRDYESINTTPGATLLSQYFEEMKAFGTECCVMEVSSHGLVQGRVDQIPIHYAGFSNLTRDHLDYHGTMEAYYSAKKKLFYLSRVSNVVNIDDSYGRRLYGELVKEKNEQGGESPKGRICSCSIKDRGSDYKAEIISIDSNGSAFRVFERGILKGEIEISIPGDYGVANALLATGLAREAGIAFSHIARGLKTFKGVPGRFEEVSKSPYVIVDYAHTPDALEHLLHTAGKDKIGRLICVFGCGGERDREKRAIMGRVAGQYCDYCIITSDNPRGENPEDIAAEVEEGLYGTGCQYHVLIDRYQAIKWAVSIWQKGDIIVVAGKGHETYQIIGKEKRHFDDREVIREIIAGQE